MSGGRGTRVLSTFSPSPTNSTSVLPLTASRTRPPSSSTSSFRSDCVLAVLAALQKSVSITPVSATRLPARRCAPRRAAGRARRRRPGGRGRAARGGRRRRRRGGARGARARPAARARRACAARAAAPSARRRPRARVRELAAERVAHGASARARSSRTPRGRARRTRRRRRRRRRRRHRRRRRRRRRRRARASRRSGPAAAAKASAPAGQRVVVRRRARRHRVAARGRPAAGSGRAAAEAPAGAGGGAAAAAARFRPAGAARDPYDVIARSIARARTWDGSLAASSRRAHSRWEAFSSRASRDRSSPRALAGSFADILRDDVIFRRAVVAQLAQLRISRRCRPPSKRRPRVQTQEQLQKGQRGVTISGKIRVELGRSNPFG